MTAQYTEGTNYTQAMLYWRCTKGVYYADYRVPKRTNDGIKKALRSRAQDVRGSRRYADDADTRAGD